MEKEIKITLEVITNVDCPPLDPVEITLSSNDLSKKSDGDES